MFSAGRAFLTAILILVPWSVAAAGATPDPAEVITAESLLGDVEFFSAPECSGRLPGTAAQTPPGTYATARLGLVPTPLPEAPMQETVQLG